MKKSSLSIDKFIIRIKNLTGKLTVCGDDVSEKHLIMYILAGLDPEYK